MPNNFCLVHDLTAKQGLLPGDTSRAVQVQAEFMHYET